MKSCTTIVKIDEYSDWFCSLIINKLIYNPHYQIPLCRAYVYKTKSLNEKEAELKKLQKEYDQAVRKLSDLEHSIKTINIKMVRAGKLVDGLKDEGIRWKDKILELTKESKNFRANVIISSTIV